MYHVQKTYTKWRQKYPIMDVAPEVLCPGDGGSERAWRSAGPGQLYAEPDVSVWYPSVI